jgi:hypothetical protein
VACVEPTDAANDRLYSCASAWNRPIPVPAPVHPASDQMRQGWLDQLSKYGRQPFGVTIATETDALAYPTTSTPLVEVHLNRETCSQQIFHIPIPSDFKVAGVVESHAAVLAPSGTEWDFYKITSPDQTPLRGSSSWPQCPANGHWNAVIIQELPASTYGWNGLGYGLYSPRASSTNEASGIIRLRDMQKTPRGGTWDHALHIAIDSTSDGSVWPRAVAPAKGGDGQCGGSWAPIPKNECIPEGARIQLDPAIDCTTWPSLATAEEWKRVWCRTMQRYGAIVVDTGSGMATESNKSSDKGDCAPASCFAGSLDWKFYAGWNNLPTDLYTHLRVIDWNVWTGQ